MAAFKVDLPESVKEAIVPRYSAIVSSVVENIHVALPVECFSHSLQKEFESIVADMNVPEVLSRLDQHGGKQSAK